MMSVGGIVRVMSVSGDMSVGGDSCSNEYGWG